MLVRIIAETHQEEADEKFTAAAKQLAKKGEIILVLENEVYSDYPGGEIEENIYAIEDKVIWEFVKIIIALSEIYPAIKKEKALDNKSLLELLGLNLHGQIKNNISDYIESYFNFLRNTKETNPVSKILIKLMNKVVNNKCFGGEAAESLLYLFNSGNEEASNDDIAFVIKNINYFNKILRLAALICRDFILENNYSDGIKKHEGLTEEWINDYFSFRFIRSSEGATLLNFDKVIIDLRNQLFVEKLKQLAYSSSESKESEKEIWFIVGESHLKGLEILAKEYGINADMIQRVNKHKLLLSIDSSINHPASLFFMPPGIRLKEIPKLEVHPAFMRSQ